jgi:universal stress protein E
VNKLTSILVIASHTESDRVLLDRAVFLARAMGAQICLFSCDSELGKIDEQAHNSADAEKAWQINQAEHLSYLRALRGAARASDVQIGIDAGCCNALYEAILNKVDAIRPDLVMKTPSGAHPLRRFAFDPTDWHLMRQCPATLMLVRRHQWKSPPQFAALVDVSEEGTLRLAETIVHTSEHFALGCRGDLDIVYSESSANDAERDRRAGALQCLRREYRIALAHVHVLSGDPNTTLPDFAARHHYDALVLGGPTHGKGTVPLIGTLTGKLVESLDCDFVLVKPERLEQGRGTPERQPTLAALERIVGRLKRRRLSGAESVSSALHQAP